MTMVGVRRRRLGAPQMRRNQNAALSPLLAVTNVPVILARLIARSVEAFGRQLRGFPERNQRRDMRADQRLPVGDRHRLQSASPGRPWRAGPLVGSRNADHL